MQKICVLLSTYNGEKYIKEQIESILNQKDVIVELIIRDDGSKDNTIDIIHKMKDSRISLIEGKNIGWKKSFSELLRKAPKCDYYAFADQDDVWKDNKLISAINKICYNNSPTVYYCDAAVVDENLLKIGEKINLDPFIDKLSNIFVCVGQGCCMVLNQAAKDLFSQYRPKADFSHEAWLCILCSYFGEVIHENKQYLYYRVTGDNTSGYGNTKRTLLIKNFWNKEFREKIYPPYAYELLNGYRNMLSEKEIDELETIVEYKKIKNKIKLIFSHKVHRQTLLGTIALKLAIALNLY